MFPLFRKNLPFQLLPDFCLMRDFGFQHNLENIVEQGAGLLLFSRQQVLV